MRFWAIVSAVLICGYALFGRTFAYVGIPSAKLFVGDLVLGLFLILSTNAVIRPWLAGLLRPTPFSEFLWSLVVFIIYGLFELVRGLELGGATLSAFQNLVFNIYPLYFFVGLWAAVTYPDLLPRIVRFLSVTTAVYGVLFYLFLRNVVLMLPGTDLPLFVTPSGSMAIMGLPCFEKNLKRWWLVLAISTFLTLAAQGRAEWLSLGVVLTLLAILTRQIRRLVWSTVFLTGLLLVGYWTNFEIPSPAGRGGSVSTGELIARAVAAVDRDSALEISRKNADFYAGTVSWRQNWWNAIWSSTNSDAGTALLGHGYGFQLNGLVSYLRNTEIRTPHNVFYYALGYTGWVGVGLFYILQATLGLTLFRVWRSTGQVFGLLIWLGTFIAAHFGNVLETPMGAIPTYLMNGMSAADLLTRVNPAIESHESMEAQSGLYDLREAMVA